MPEDARNGGLDPDEASAASGAAASTRSSLKAAAAPHGAEPPLVIDLDGTLVPVDTLHESALALIARDAAKGIVALLGLVLRHGFRRAPMKRALAARIAPDPAKLPYRASVLALARKARDDGRRVALVTAADQRIADAVADHLGLFDEVHGSDGDRNLGGDEKAALLVARFGRGGFDYVGDARGDLPVWAQARRVITAGASPRLRARAAALGADGSAARHPLHLDPEPRGLARFGPALRALRPHQWVKNLLVFLPLLATHSLRPQDFEAIITAAIAFCLTASAAYVFNDLLDLEADRVHPRKRFRPFAAGEIPALHGIALGGALLALGLAIAGSVNALLFGTVTFYFGATMLYSLVLKRELVIDICLLAGLYTLRVLAGAAALQIYLSPWMLALSVFLFLSLGAMKRQTELVDAVAAGRGKAAGRAYQAEDLTVVTMMAIAAGYVSVLVLALYIYTPQVLALYNSPLILWGAPPILLYWLSRLVMLAHRGRMDDDPVHFALNDRISLACGAGICSFIAAAKWF